MKLLAVVASLDALPEQFLDRGQVGTVVAELGEDHVLVEFADLNGRTYALTPIHTSNLVELKHAPFGRNASRRL